MNGKLDPLYAVDDRIVVIAEDDIAVFAHDLDDQAFFLKIAHIVKMLEIKIDDALKPWLRDIRKLCRYS